MSLDLQLNKIESAGSLILMVCRDKEGQRWTVQVPFRPYFYIDAEECAKTVWPDTVTLDMGYTSCLDGRPLVKVICKTPGEVSKRRRGKKHYEADVPYERRFLIDSGIRRGFRLHKYEVLNEEHRSLRAEVADIEPWEVEAPMYGMLYDIETNRNKAGKYTGAVLAEGPVTAISLNEAWWTPSGFQPEEKIVTLQWHPSHEAKPKTQTHLKYSHAFGKEILWDVTTFSTEEEMLLAFVKRIKDHQYDVWAAWNGHYGFKISNKRKRKTSGPKSGGTGGFDAPYLINRLDKLKIGSNQLSQFNNATARFQKKGDEGEVTWICEVGGVQLVDMMTAYSIKDGGMTGAVPFAGLKAVVESKTTMPVFKDPESIEDWWMNSNARFLDYSFQDVDALMVLEKKEDYVGYLKRFQWFAGTTDANDIFRPSILVDTLCLRKAREVGVVLPSAGQDDPVEDPENDGRGGHVMRPRRKGILENVVVLDFTTMYVTIMQSCNVGRDTIVLEGMEQREDDIIVPLKADFTSTVRFRNPNVKLGIIPQILDDLRKLRGAYDAKIKLAKSPAEVKELKKAREPFKQLLLSAYGVQLNEFFRLAHPHAGLAIPAAGRFLIKTTIAKTEELDTPAFYCDTDSELVVTPEEMDPVTFGYWLERQMKKAFDAGAIRMNLKAHSFEMGFEKVYSVFGMGDDMKHYAGIVHWAEGHYADPIHTAECDGECKHLEYAGIDLAVHGAPSILKEAQKHVIRGFLDQKDTGKLIRYVKGVYDSIRAGDIPIKEVSPVKKLNFNVEKDVASTYIEEGAKTGSELHSLEYRTGMRVYTIKTRGVQEWLSVPQEDEVPEGIEVDWDHHAKKMFLDKMETIFDWISEGGVFQSIELNTKPTKQQRLPGTVFASE